MPTPNPRFRWMFTFAAQGSPVPGGSTSHVVIDLQPPHGAPGQVDVFGVFPTREAAEMACLALNGQESPS